MSVFWILYLCLQSGGNVINWAKFAVLSCTDTTVTTNDWMLTSGPSVRSASGVNNTRELKKKTKWNGSQPTPHFKEDSVLDETIEETHQIYDGN